MSNNTSDGLRLYCVVDIDDFGGELELDGVSVVQFRDLGAVVSPAEYVQTEPTDDDIEHYTKIIDELYESGPVIPAPVGALFRSDDVLRHWLEIHYAALHKTLGDIERRASPTPPYEYVRMQLGV
jgi:hypothetical protein